MVVYVNRNPSFIVEVNINSHSDGKVVFMCVTEDAIVKSSTSVNGAGNREEMEFELFPVYTITAYATKANLPPFSQR